jgi:hypothetical protein
MNAVIFWVISYHLHRNYKNKIYPLKKLKKRV